MMSEVRYVWQVRVLPSDGSGQVWLRAEEFGDLQQQLRALRKERQWQRGKWVKLPSGVQVCAVGGEHDDRVYLRRVLVR